MDPSHTYNYQVSTRNDYLVNHDFEWLIRYLGWNNFSEARKRLKSAEKNGATSQEISLYESKIKAAEMSFEAKKKENLFLLEKKIFEGDIAGARECLDSLKKCGVPVHNTESKIKAIELLQNVKKQLEQAWDLLARESPDISELNSLMLRARGDFRLAVTYDRSLEQLTDYKNRFEAIEILTQMEKDITSAQRFNAKYYLEKAKESFESVKQSNIPHEKIDQLQKKIDETELSFQTADIGIQASNDNIAKVISNYCEEKNVAKPAVFTQSGPEIPCTSKEQTYMEIDQPDFFGDNRNEFKVLDNIEEYNNFTGSSATAKTIQITVTKYIRNIEYKTSASICNKNDSEYDYVISKHGNDQQHVNSAYSQNNNRHEISHSDNNIRNTSDYYNEHNFSAHNNMTEQNYVKSENKASSAEQTDHVSNVNQIIEKSANTDTNKHGQTYTKSQSLMQSIEKPVKDSNIGDLETPQSHSKPFEKAVNNPNTKPPLPEKPTHSPNWRQDNADRSEKSRPEACNYEKAIRENKATTETMGLPKNPINHNPDQNEKSLTYEQKCKILAKKALKDGNVAIAKKIVDIAEKLYPEADFSFVKEAIFAATHKSSEPKGRNYINVDNKMVVDNDNKMVVDNNKVDHLATAMENININASSNVSLVNEKQMNKTEYNVYNNATVKASNSGYAIKPKEKHKVLDTDDDYKENHVSESNLGGDREEARKCLEKAREALEQNDFEKAQRLALKSDRMNACQEAKLLLQKVIEAKSTNNNRNITDETYNSGVKDEGSNYSTSNAKDPDQARKCLEIACAAFEEDKLEKCKRFLKKANHFDSSVNIECYLTSLQSKKVQVEMEKKKAKQAELEKERMKKQAEEKERMKKQAEERERMKKQAEIEKEKNKKQAETKGLTITFKNALGYAGGLLGFDSSKTQGSKPAPKTQDAKAQNENKLNKVPAENKHINNEVDKNRNNSNSSHNTHKSTTKADKGQILPKNYNSQETTAADDMYEDAACGGSTDNHEEENKGKNAENTHEQDLSPEEKAKISKAEDLVAKAFESIDQQDFESAEALLTTAYALHPTEAIQSSLEQVKEEKIKMNGNGQHEDASANNNQRTARKDNAENKLSAYEENMQHYDKKIHPTRVFRSQERSQPYEQRARPNRSKSRVRCDTPQNVYQDKNVGQNRKVSHSNDAEMQEFYRSEGKTQPCNNQHARPNRSKSTGRYETPQNLYQDNNKTQNCKVTLTNTAEMLRHFGIKAYEASQYGLAERYLQQSEQIQPHHITRDLLNHVRQEKNRQSNIDFSYM